MIFARKGCIINTVLLRLSLCHAEQLHIHIKQRNDNMNKLEVYDVRVQPGDSAFLLDDGEAAVLFDSGFGFTGFGVADNIKKRLGDRRLDCILLSHSHYDHALGSAYITQRYPNTRVAAGEYAASVFPREGAQRVMRELDRKFADKCGVGEYPFLGDKLRVDIPLKDGDIVNAGGMSFRAVNLPGHTKCSIGYYCAERKLLLSSETIGVYDGGEIIVPSFLVGYEMTLRSIERVEQLEINRLLAPHLGILSEEQTEYFLGNAKRAAVEAAQFITESVKSGRTDAEIIAEFKRHYLRGYIADIYPEDAADLNTSIMIKLIKREVMGITE